MKYFKQNELDFGTVTRGTTQTIEVDYIGEEAFEIKGMSTSCGCTKPSYDDVSKKVKFSVTFHNPGNFRATGSYKGEYIIVKAEVK